MFGFILGLFFLTLAASLTWALIISYHFWAYRIQGDRGVQILGVFLIGSALLFITLIAAFLAVPWNDIPSIIQSYR